MPLNNPAQSFGDGQTWQDVAASRAVNTVYTNTTGKTIAVNVKINSGFNRFLEVNTSGSFVRVGESSPDSRLEMTAIVPAGASYKVSIGPFKKWREFR